MKAANYLALIVLLALTSSSLVLAGDPSPVQDFCVAVNDTKTSVFVNGKVCKDHNNVTADDFYFHGLNRGDTATSPLGLRAVPVTVENIPGLNTLGIALARIDLAPGGVNPVHIHPRASEIFYVVEGTIFVGFVTTNPERRLFTKVLHAGDVFVFPIGLIHFQRNIGKTNAFAISGLNSQNPGVIALANGLFGAHPLIPQEVLTRSFQVDKSVIDHLEKQIQILDG